LFVIPAKLAQRARAGIQNGLISLIIIRNLDSGLRRNDALIAA